MGVLALLFVKTLVTETKGRSLEEIEADLQERDGHGRPPRHIAATAPR